MSLHRKLCHVFCYLGRALDLIRSKKEPGHIWEADSELVATGRWTWNLPSLPELLLKLMDELVLFLDNKVLGPDIRQERVVIAIGVGLMMGL